MLGADIILEEDRCFCSLMTCLTRLGVPTIKQGELYAPYSSERVIPSFKGAGALHFSPCSRFSRGTAQPMALNSVSNGS